MFTPVPQPDAGREPGAARVLAVSELNRLARETLERSFPLAWIAGEVSGLTRAASGHIYFSLKDEAAQVRCVMFRSRAQLLSFRLDNGMRVEARALVTLYEPRGDYQLNVEAIRQAGQGNLYEAFVRLKQKLEKEGLFATERKRALPRLPRRIGVVSSPQAAALRDVLAALARRAPHVPLILYPAAVQGDTAPAQLALALGAANRARAAERCDVLLLVRGGGAIEDLAAFNDEALARTIADSDIPVIAGVGHETDFTIADFVADKRAATPTAAAELASSGWFAAAGELTQLRAALARAMRAALDQRTQRTDLAARRLIHPAQRLRETRGGLAQLATRLGHAHARGIERAHARVAQLRLRLGAARPDPRVSQAQVNQLAERLRAAHARNQDAARARLARAADALQHLSPQATLERGYSISYTAAGEIVRDAAQVAAGSALEVRFARGRAQTRVEDTREE